jgi:hypothetical protein
VSARVPREDIPADQLSVLLNLTVMLDRTIGDFGTRFTVLDRCSPIGDGLDGKQQALDPTRSL